MDEAGDEGLGRLKLPGNYAQSKWLLIGGIVVSKENDALLPKWRDGIMSLFPAKKNRDLHFQKLSHDQRVAACKWLADKPMKVVTVCSNKITIADNDKFYSTFKKKGYLYNYLTRFFLERVTTRCGQIARETGRDVKLEVRFSRRGGTNYDTMKEYLELTRDGLEAVKPIRSINWNVFSPEDIRVENHSRLAGLQLADVVTSATFHALEPNVYGHYEPRYALSLAKSYLSRGSTVHDCGFTLIPRLIKCGLDEHQSAFASALQESWQAPGP